MAIYKLTMKTFSEELKKMYELKKAGKLQGSLAKNVAKEKAKNAAAEAQKVAARAARKDVGNVFQKEVGQSYTEGLSERCTGRYQVSRSQAGYDEYLE